MTKKWVFGWVYEAKERDLVAMTADRDFWRDAHLALLPVAGKAVTVAEKQVEGG